MKPYISQLNYSNYQKIVNLFIIITFIFLIKCDSVVIHDTDLDYMNLSGYLLSKRINKINLENLKEDHGYIILNYNFNNLKMMWLSTIIINNKVYFQHSLLDSKEYKILVPIGINLIHYKLKGNVAHLDTLTTNVGFFNDIKLEGKTIKLFIEKEAIYRLNIVKTNNESIGLSIVSSGGCVIPFPKRYHDVSFEVEKIKNAEKILNDLPRD